MGGFVRGQVSQGVDLIKDGQVYKYDTAQDRFVPVDLPAYFTAVVDIGPHSNTGPGDQTKGIRNWATTPIVLTADPLATQYIQLISISLQLKFNAVAYSETAPTQILALMSSVQGSSVLTDVGASSPFKSFVESGVPDTFHWSKIDNALINGTITWGPAADLGEGLAFGDSQNSGAEFIAGDGTVRITVHYTIDDILT